MSTAGAWGDDPDLELAEAGCMHLDDDLVIGAHPRHRLLERGVSEHELAGPLWRATGSGRYAFAGTDADDPRQRTREAAARLPPTGAVGGWAAGHLHGAHELDGRGPWGRSEQPVLVCLTPSHHLATGEGLLISRSRLDEDDVTCVDGVRCTTLVRTAFDLARLTHDPREAVVAMDVLFRCTDLDLGDVLAYSDQRRRWAGRRQLLQVLSLADAHTLSMPETRLRLLWVLDARLPTPLVNRLIIDQLGHPLARADLLDEAAALVGEQDGAHHGVGKQRSEDEQRTDRLHRVGLRVVRFTSYDTADERRWRTAQRLRAVRREQLARPTSPRRWAVMPLSADTRRQ